VSLRSGVYRKLDLLADLHRASHNARRPPGRKAGLGTAGWIVVGAAALAVIAVVVAVAVLLLGSGGSRGQAPGPEQVRRGEEIYQASCASCHGARGEGDPNWRTRNADGSFKSPPHDNSGHTWHHGDGQLFNIVKHGGQGYAGPGLASRMPGFGEQLSDQEIRAVIAFLKSFWGAEERRYQAEVSRSDPLP